MTTPEQWLRVKKIAGEALECEATELTLFLDRACSENEELRREVESLVAAYGASDGFSVHPWHPALDASLVRTGGASGVYPALDFAQSQQVIGPYRLLRMLGTGGMGEVWLAEQTEPVCRLVALKLIRAGLSTPQIAQRFLAERQSLALMSHPCIAKIFDAGATSAGQPYLVMEYIDGCPMTEYCERKQLSIADRLRLFQLVCEGVQHAHQKAVIHRDLKPSNLLVTEVDGRAVPRIIDFGVAKALVQDLHSRDMFTEAGSLLGTLGYMSPEQAGADAQDVDTRSDVYSLGVVLYELLVGALPFDVVDQPYYAALRQLCEEDAPRPSTRLRALNDPQAAQVRGTTTSALVRSLRGDADAVVLKALEKDRSRRYASPADLASDVERFLRNEPVTARAASVGYLARKYVRRHRMGVVVVAVVAVLLIASALIQTFELHNTRRERDRADHITSFMTDMFQVSDPGESRGATVTAREILDKSSNRIASGVGLDGAVQADLMLVMAKTYEGLGLYTRAHLLAQRGFDERVRSRGADDPKTLEAMTLLVSIFSREGRDKEAEAFMRATLDRENRVLGPASSLAIEVRNDLASLLNQHARFSEAEKVEREAVDLESRKPGLDMRENFRTRNTLVMALNGQSKFEEAEKDARELFESERQTLGADDPYLLVTMHNLAVLLADQSRSGEAEALYRQTLAIQNRVLGPEHLIRRAP